MKLKTLIDEAKLDMTDIRFAVDGGTGIFMTSELRPEDFIAYAKDDFIEANSRGLVNALSNAKRAVDCQVDNFLIAIGFDPENLDKQLGSNGLASLKYQSGSSDGPLKLRLLRALGVAAPQIVDRLRQLRHLLEHEYKEPRRSEVRSAIDIAELFVHACRGKMNSAFSIVFLGSGTVESEGWDFENRIRIYFSDYPAAKCSVMSMRHELDKSHRKQTHPEIEVARKDEGYVPLLKLVWHADWDNDMTEPVAAFLSELGFQLPRKFRVKRADF